jgi:hypothetical protein
MSRSSRTPTATGYRYERAASRRERNASPPRLSATPGNKVVHKLQVFGKYLYAGTENDTAGGEIFRTGDAKTWTRMNTPGFGTGRAQRIRSFFVLGPYIYANAQNDLGGHGWELWRSR